jgi:hypothetical protein
MDITAIISFVTENGGQILAAIGALYLAATAVAAITPTKADDEFLGKAKGWLLRIGLDFSKKPPKE